MTRSILVVLSDTHGGNKAGLMHPGVILFDEDQNGNPVPYTPEPTATQSYLFDLYQRNIAATLELAAGDPIDVIHNGDLAQGNKYPQSLVSTRVSDHILIAEANLAPWLEIPNVRSVRLAVGTGAHEFGEGAATIMVASLLKRRYPERDIAAAYHGLVDYDGCLVDYSHHGPHPGSREWLKGNVARFYLRDLMMREVMAHNTPPHLVLRAHFHTYVREVLEVSGYESTLIITPSYCFMTDHARQATRSQHMISVGQVVFEIENGAPVKMHKQYETHDLRTRERIA